MNTMNAKDMTFCARCGAGCQHSGQKPGEEAQMLRRAKPGNDGFCATCAVREWFYAMRHVIPEIGDVQHLLLPHIQQAFAGLMAAAKADMKPGEIKWQKLVDEWDLPIPGAGKGIDRKLRKMDVERADYEKARHDAGDPTYKDLPLFKAVDMRAKPPSVRKKKGVGVDDLAQARAAREARKKKGLLN